MIFNTTQGQGQEGATKLGITDNAAIIQSLLTDRLYKEPIPAILRELVCNAKDSHTEAGQTKPVEIKLNKGNLTIKDFGVGLTPEEFNQNIGVLGNSTKRSSANLIGCMGIGSLSPFGYTDQIMYTCVKDKKKFIGYLSRGNEGIEYLTTPLTDTTEENGVEITIKIDPSNYWEFKEGILKHLRYFQGIWVECADDLSVFNNFKTWRAPNFQVSNLSKANEQMHICFDDVFYPIDWVKLGIKPILIPIGLRFSLTDGLMPIPNREALAFNKETCEKVMNKIKTVSTELIARFNKDISANTLKERLDIYKEGPKLKFGDTTLFLSELTPYSSVESEHDRAPNVSKKVFSKFAEKFNNMLSQTYSKVGKTDGDKLRYFQTFKSIQFYGQKVLLLDCAPKGLTREYIKETYPHMEIWEKRRKITLKREVGAPVYTSYKDLLGLYYEPKENWRTLIKEFQVMEGLLNETFIINPEPSPEWITERKKNRKKAEKRIIPKDEITLSYGREPLISAGLDCVFDKYTKINLDNLHRNPLFTVYSKDKQKLSGLWRFANTSDRFNIAYLGERESAKLEKQREKNNLHNFMSYDNFIKGDSRPFGRIAVGILAHKLINSNPHIFRYLSLIEYVHSDLAKACKSLQKLPFKAWENTEANSILSVAEEYNLFDPKSKQEYDYVKEMVSYFDFLPCLIRKEHYGGSDVIPKASFPLIVEILKGRKLKLNLEHYQSKTENGNEQQRVESAESH